MDFDIVTFGDLVTDIYLPIPQLPVNPKDIQIAHQISTEPGGAGNFLIMAERLGLRTAALGSVGDDLYGNLSMKKLQGEGIDISSVNIVTGKSTTLIIVLIDDAGEHAFLGALGTVQVTEIENSINEKIEQSKALFTNGYAFLESSPPELVVELMKQFRRINKLVFFDPGPQIQQVDAELMKMAIAQADYLLLTQEEAATIVDADSAEEIAHKLLNLGPKLVVLKMGAEGSLVVTPRASIKTPAFSVDIRDSTGCGDAFDAAFAYGIINDMPLGEISKLANAAGGATVTRIGAGTGLPPKSEIENLLKKI